MSGRQIAPPWDYLHEASAPSLQSYELSRLNHAANLRREISALLDQWVEDTAHALLARWVRQDRLAARPAMRGPDRPAQPELPFSDPLPTEPPGPHAARPERLTVRRSRTGTDD